MAEAENIKLGVEQSQRDRRRQADNMQVNHHLQNLNSRKAAFYWMFQREGFTPLWFQLEEEVEGEEGVARKVPSTTLTSPPSPAPPQVDFQQQVLGGQAAGVHRGGVRAPVVTPACCLVHLTC